VRDEYDRQVRSLIADLPWLTVEELEEQGVWKKQKLYRVG
jgi:hypothetical protein